MNLDQLNALIRQSGPTLYLHPDERYKTCSFAAYATAPQVYLGAPSGGQHAPNPLPSGDDSKGQFLAYAWDDTAFQAQGAGGDGIYVHALPSDKYDAGGLELQFWHNYAFNGPGNAGLGLSLELKGAGEKADCTVNLDFETGPMGEHQGDWEHFSLYFDAQQKLTHLYCSQHSDGTVYYPPGTPDQPTWTEAHGRPVLYASLNGHATYNGPQTFPTPGGGFSLPEHEFDFFFGRFSVKLTKGAFGLINECGPGAALECSQLYQLVASSVPGAELPTSQEPSWLQFLGRSGFVDPPVKDVADAVEHDLNEALRSALEKLLPKWAAELLDYLPSALAGYAAKPIISFLSNHIENFNGPTMPKAKSDWTA